MDPLIAEVFGDVQAILGEPPGGDVYNAEMLTPFFGTAYRDIFSLLMKWGIPFVTREAYFVLPANTNQAAPAQYYISDLGEPERLWERGSVQTRTISAIADSTPVQITTTTPHGFGTGVVNLFGIPAPDVVGVNGVWFATKLDSTNLTLNGSLAGGSATSGTLAYSTERWIPMELREDLVDDPGSQLRFYRWRNGTFYFNGATEAREIKIEYIVSGNPPTSGRVGLDNSKDYLVYRTAALASRSREEDQFQPLNMMACGDSMIPDGTGGFLAALVTPMLRQKQRIGQRRGPFRQRRHNFAYGPHFE